MYFEYQQAVDYGEAMPESCGRSGCDYGKATAR
jgi:hypothetical protein